MEQACPSCPFSPSPGSQSTSLQHTQLSWEHHMFA